jgi:hypothetical protein
MMRGLLRYLLFAVMVMALVLCTLGRAQAARGVPGSADFGIGAAIYPDGPFLTEALEIAETLELDWVSAPLVWSAAQPDPAQAARLDNLDRVMQFAGDHQIPVLISLTSAPDWAKTMGGPNPEKVAQFAAWLASRYSGSLQAIELFPAANTREGWGADPDARVYSAMLAAVTEVLLVAGDPVLLVAGGLRPVVNSSSNGDVSDLVFLDELYKNGAMRFMPVVSLQLDKLNGAPISFPESTQQTVLRHYEEVRRVMTENGHQNSLIWITRFSPPSGTIETSDSVNQAENMQSNWMSLAYIQLRSQLYVGVTFGQSLNPESGGTSAGFPSMIGGANRFHPFYSVLREMISLNKTGSVSIMPGKPKEGGLGKMR